jgi:hypothetical protein
VNKLGFILAAGLALAPIVSAQTVKPEDRNAALKYATAFYAEYPGVIKAAGEVDMSKVGLEKAQLPEDFAKVSKQVREEGQRTVRELIEASKLARCDFEVPLEQGWNTLMPHMGKMRAAARLLRVDARRCAVEGDSAGAAERLVAMVGMARHAANDQVLISSLVSAAIANVAAEEAEAEMSVLSPEARQSVAAALTTMSQGDPFQMKGAVRGEQRMTTGWIKAKFQGPNAGREYAAMMAPGEQAPSAAETKAQQALSVMNGQQLSAAADLLNPYYSEALKVWDAPDSFDQLSKLGGRVEGGEFGPMGVALAPALSKARASELKAKKRIELAAAKLSGK